jgi:hypothetical protein
VTFYHAANASRAVKLPGGKRFTFDVYKFFAGAWLGVAAVEDKETMSGLDELVRKPKSGITRITQAEYAANLKKKTHQPNLRLLPVSPQPQAPPVPIDLVGNPAQRRAVVVENGKPVTPPPPAATANGKVFDLSDIQVGVIEPSASSIIKQAAPKRDMGERSFRAQDGKGKYNVPTKDEP